MKARARGPRLPRTGLCALGILAGTLAAHAGPDSLTVRDKGLINAFAESAFQGYIRMLNSITELDRGDPEAQWLTDEFIKSSCQAGPDQVFIGPEAQIEDNVNPETNLSSVARNRTLKEYSNDLLLLFKREERKGGPVEAKLLKKGEPGITQQVYTRILYEVQLHGSHVTSKASYQRHQRVLDLVARKEEKGGWRVLISADSWYDPAKGFAEFALERDTIATAESEEYRNSARQALEAADRERADRRAAYDKAIAQGKASVAAGEYELGISMYEQAKTLAPLEIDPLILITSARRAKQEKELRDRKEFEALMDKGAKLHEMHEHERSLKSFREAAQIYADDPRCKPMIDSLENVVRAKTDRESPYNAGNYQAMLTETQRLLKTSSGRTASEVRVLQAKCLIKLNRRSEALVVLGNVITAEPTYAEARMLHAEILEKGDDKNKLDAIEDYLVLKNHDVWDMTSYHHYAMLLCWLQRKCSEGDKVLHEALDREPGNVQTLYLLGKVNGREGLLEYPTSVKHLNEAIVRDSACAKCYMELGISLLEMDSAAAADIAVRKALSLKLGQEHIDRSRQLAKASFEAAKKLAENKARSDADRLYLRACVLDPGNPEYRLIKARNLMAFEQYERAIADLDIHINATPAPYQALLDRAACELAIGMNAQALADVERIRQNHIEELEEKANLLAGKAAFNMNDIAKAEGHLRTVLKINKKNSEALRLMTVISLRSDRPQEGRNYAKQAVDMDPQNPETHYNLGLALQAVKDEGGSVAAFEQAIALGAEREEATKQMGRSCMLAGKYKAALEHFERRMRLKDDVEVPQWMAECHFELQQYAQAIGILNDLLAKHPEVETQSDFLAQMAMLYVITDNLAVAKTYVDKAVGVSNIHKGTLLTRAAYYWKAERQQEAVDELHLLVTRGLTSEKELRTMPILKDIMNTKLWRAKAEGK